MKNDKNWAKQIFCFGKIGDHLFLVRFLLFWVRDAVLRSSEVFWTKVWIVHSKNQTPKPENKTKWLTFLRTWITIHHLSNFLRVFVEASIRAFQGSSLCFFSLHRNNDPLELHQNPKSLCQVAWRGNLAELVVLQGCGGLRMTHELLAAESQSWRFSVVVRKLWAGSDKLWISSSGFFANRKFRSVHHLPMQQTNGWLDTHRFLESVTLQVFGAKHVVRVLKFGTNSHNQAKKRLWHRGVKMASWKGELEWMFFGTRRRSGSCGSDEYGRHAKHLRHSCGLAVTKKGHRWVGHLKDSHCRLLSSELQSLSPNPHPLRLQTWALPWCSSVWCPQGQLWWYLEAGRVLLMHSNFIPNLTTKICFAQLYQNKTFVLPSCPILNLLWPILNCFVPILIKFQQKQEKTPKTKSAWKITCKEKNTKNSKTLRADGNVLFGVMLVLPELQINFCDKTTATITMQDLKVFECSDVSDTNNNTQSLQTNNLHTQDQPMACIFGKLQEDGLLMTMKMETFRPNLPDFPGQASFLFFLLSFLVDLKELVFLAKRLWNADGDKIWVSEGNLCQLGSTWFAWLHWADHISPLCRFLSNKTDRIKIDFGLFLFVLFFGVSVSFHLTEFSCFGIASNNKLSLSKWWCILKIPKRLVLARVTNLKDLRSLQRVLWFTISSGQSKTRNKTNSKQTNDSLSSTTTTWTVFHKEMSRLQKCIMWAWMKGTFVWLTGRTNQRFVVSQTLFSQNTIQTHLYQQNSHLILLFYCFFWQKKQKKIFWWWSWMLTESLQKSHWRSFRLDSQTTFQLFELTFLAHQSLWRSHHKKPNSCGTLFLKILWATSCHLITSLLITCPKCKIQIKLLWLWATPFFFFFFFANKQYILTKKKQKRNQ